MRYIMEIMRNLPVKVMDSKNFVIYGLGSKVVYEDRLRTISSKKH